MRERYTDAVERIREITAERTVERPFRDFFRREVRYIGELDGLLRALRGRTAWEADIACLRDAQRLYTEAAEQYESSYLNPAYAARTLSEYGAVLSALAMEIHGLLPDCFERREERITTVLELFLEIYCMFEVDNEDMPTARAVRDCFYSYCYDYSEELQRTVMEELYTRKPNLLKRIILEEDFRSTDYLYRSGEYVSEETLRTAEFILGLGADEIDRMAYAWYFGFKEGFRLQRKPYEKKSLLSFRFPAGFERVVQRTAAYFAEDGYDFSLPRSPRALLLRSPRGAGGYYVSSNRQLDYDHSYDLALVMGERISARMLEERRQLFRRYETEGVRDYAGPVVMESFGEPDFVPENRTEALCFSPHQTEVYGKYQSALQRLTHEYIREEERSFTIIAWPLPSIGAYFPEIFRETFAVNTLDSAKYGKIQERLIAALDSADFIRVTGRGNETDMRVCLHPLSDPERETRFENCLSDVNIPLGEVFTSPVLEGSEGLLHVNEVFIEGICFRGLRIRFTDGRVADYSCENFPDREEGRKLIRRLIFGEKERLPLGEFAIGTNTRAYRMIERFGLGAKMPILIAEKTGPHFAVGDTCYSFMEEMRLYNPDGREIIAKDNSCSILRKTCPEDAYFAVHTDITIPYRELGDILAVRRDGAELAIVKEGKFVLPGTEELNEVL